MSDTFPNLNLLLTLKVLLEERHVTLAARRLCLTQSAVSKRLTLLRDIFHDPLLVRVGNVLEPTALALSLRPRLNRLFEEADSLVHTAAFDLEKGELTVNLAVTDFSLQSVLPKILCTMLRECPGLRLKTHVWQRLHITELLLGEVHCAKCHFTEHEISAEFHSIRLHSRAPVCIMRRGHPLADTELTLETFLKAQHISYLYEHDCTNWLDESLTKLGLKRNIVVRYPSVYGGLLMVQNSDLIMSTSREVADEYADTFNLVVRPSPVNLPPSPEYFIWHERYEHNPGHRWFRERFLELYRSCICTDLEQGEKLIP